MLAAVIFKKVLNELGNVLAPLGERGHPDRHDRQPVEQVLAEPPLGDRLGEVPAGRGDDAHVDMNARRAADALKVLVDQHAQDLGLRLARHVGDFVEIERAAMRLFERADPARPVRAGFDAEQLRLHPLGRHRRRVDDDEGTVRARRTVRE